MPRTDIENYFEQRRAQISLPVRLYALVDGLLYARVQASVDLERSAGNIALFDGTPDEALASAGPWLIDLDQTSAAIRTALREMGAGGDGVSWLLSAYPFRSLAAELQDRLNVLMPDGRTALLRFYDARLIHDIAALLSFSQRAEFFVPTFDWLVQVNDELRRVHPHA